MIARSFCTALLLWLCTAGAAAADDANPPPVATPVTVSTDVAPTALPVATAVLPTVPPVVEPTAVSVAPERNTPVVSVSNPQPAVPTPRPEGAPPNSHPVAVQPQPVPGSGLRTSPSPSAGPLPSPGSPAGVAASVPPDISLPDGSPDTSSGLGLTSEPSSAQAPAQLTCSPRHHPLASPFLSAPYAGWTELVSFVDHDRPDYSVDGTIVLANGLTAKASDGQASDLFPAYWSPALRQYVNYDGHNGYDFDISYQPVLAAAAGTVEYAGWNDPNPYVGYGQMVLINHHNGYVTLYGHLSKLEVSTGDRVESGQEIGISGTTGHSSGPHLHFSVFHDCQVADPYGWTGKGKDPLEAFTGSASAYLWLPGHDPLVLNPPPNWPAYPLGLQVAPSPNGSADGVDRAVPAADRLLLLALPSAPGRESLDPATALVRTEAAITTEAETLAPDLNTLRAQGVITDYQIIPGAAAVWVRGLASSDELETLPGVASLSGVQPHDIRAAEAGLAHAILAQIGRQQAPALWPVGFRAGLHSWRPVATVVAGQAFVAGLALPGKAVIVSLQRGASVPAAAVSASDRSTGGFVALLEDGAGNPVRVGAGDKIRVACDGRTTVIDVHPVSLAARAAGIRGRSVPAASGTMSLLDPAGSVRAAAIAADGRGRFQVAPPGHLLAGSEAIASFTDVAGNEQAIASVVPGLAVTLGSNVIRGWTVGSHPHLLIRRAGRTIEDSLIHSDIGGTFALTLGGDKQPLTVRAGDVIEIGPPGHRRSLAVPAISPSILSGGIVAARGPSGSSESVALATADGADFRRTVAIPDSGRTNVSFPVRSIGAGDRVTVTIQSHDGDAVRATSTSPNLVLEEGTPLVRGMAPPGPVLAVTLLNGIGRVVGRTAAVPDEAKGRFSAVVRNLAGRPVRLGRGVRIEIGADGATRTVDFPRLRLIAAAHSRGVLLQGPAGTRLAIRITGGGRPLQQLVRLGPSGRERLSLNAARTSARSITVVWAGPSGVTVERTLRLRARH